MLLENLCGVVRPLALSDRFKPGPFSGKVKAAYAAEQGEVGKAFHASIPR